ncbi:MAG: homocysteine S-methyltransferase family protein [Lachnospiraceae bacterium]|nr:homocysteine S-methyltransferase family protein [Lachnospiraceae bacterium]
MTKEAFARLVKEKIVYLDGATGSNLMQAGMPAGVCPESWILDHKEALISLQRAYVKAGSNIVYAPTFTANRIKLAEYGLEKEIASINKNLVALSKEAVGGQALVAGDLTMTGKQLKPMGPLEFEELIEVYKEQIRYLEEAGVDLLVIETMMSLQETRAAAIAAMEVTKLPVMATLTFEEDGRTLFGSDPASAAIALTSLHVDAIGANCSTGPDKMCQVIRTMAEVTNLPLIAKPNAGLPSLNEEGMTVYDMDALTFAEEMKAIVESGASILGGCCGTTPKHIEKLVEATSSLSVKRTSLKGKRFLCSERQSLVFTLEDRFMIVGERINPTGKKKLQAELREGNLEMVSRFAAEQEECGARLLDINVGMSGIDEKEMMLAVLEEVANVTSLPLAIDSSHVDVIEAALRRYPGRALINSISLESAKIDALLPIARKYGAMFILLPLWDAGLPQNIEEKQHIIEEVLKRAYALGFTNDDIVVDGLVATVAANPNAGKETLDTIRYCKEKGLATICGLSNISFGLPERININSAFLTLAIGAGLTMAIANPGQEMLVNASLSADLLMAKGGADLAYIDRMNGGMEGEKAAEETPLSKVREAVLKGKQRDILSLTQGALDAGCAPDRILNEALLPAIEEVGDLFDSGKYFLPQLIASAETMKKSIELLEPLLKETGSQAVMPTIVIATVKGDIHDIGKNLVALMLKNHGFGVVDLGKDVPREEIIKAARDNHAKIIALSALMTTTMQEMKQVIDLAKKEGLSAKVMIGGAVITQEYADEIGADGYSKDAAEAVKLAQRLCEE